MLLIAYMTLLTQNSDAQPPLVLPTESPRLLSTKTTLIFGQKIVYYDVGSGPTIVLLHGLGSEAIFDWGHVILPLSQRHRVVALDQIGFGASDKPLVDYSIQTFVDFLAEFLRTLGLQQFTLVGESFGGWVAALYSIQALAPENTGAYASPKPERLILSDAAGLAAPPSGNSLPIPGSLRETGSIAIMFHDKLRVTEDFVRQKFAMQLKANDGPTQRSLWSNPQLGTEIVGSKLTSITIPTLVVWGADDEIIPVDQGRQYAAKIPNGKLVIIPDCGHVPPLEQPEAFLSAVIPFLN
jgi:pimeloyl-ACP methyl ester carboxylesterase